MPGAISEASWICSRCLLSRRAPVGRRWLSTATCKLDSAITLAKEGVPPPASAVTSQATQDEKALRSVFDSATYWRNFNASNGLDTRSGTGLLRNRYLTRPEGFQQFAEITLAKCHRLVAKTLAYDTVEQYKQVARDLDRLSDLLCRVIDLSDFIRAVHPDVRMQAAAGQAYAQMFEYMNVLNTTTGLNDVLKKASSIPEVWSSWTEEEQTVATILLRDFSHSAIDMRQSDRESFVRLSSEIVETGSTFVDAMAAEKPYLSFSSSKLRGMDPRIVKQYTQWGKVTLPTGGAVSVTALRTVEDPEVRKQIYLAHRTSAKDNLHRLERLLKRRAELAKLSGFESYGHLTLSEKMSGSPQAVKSFLETVARTNAPLISTELHDLASLKAQSMQQMVNTANISAWDRDYYGTKLMASMRNKHRAPDFLSAYFSLGTVLQGLSKLYHRLYGIRLVPRATLPGETWNDDVRCIDVVDDTEGQVAVIYCDLFQRHGKSPNPAHFTLRCSRQISEEELQETATTAQQTSMFDTAEEVASDGLATAYSQDGVLYQLPTIALICDFAINSSRTTPALLSFREVRTLWHEMGHALHSICGRTKLQNVAGTRCPTDFAELPSVLNESFASAPEVLALWARHWETDEPLDVERVKHKINVDKRMEGAEIESQILLGMLDQHYHSALPLSWPDNSNGEPSTQVFRDVWSEYSAVPEPDGTSYQGFFGHLFSYGATYYSYLFDRAIAGKIWKDVFQRTEAGALDPEAGRRYREEVLRWGGSRDGWKSIGSILRGTDGEVVAAGGPQAMQTVGKWPVTESWG